MPGLVRDQGPRPTRPPRRRSGVELPDEVWDWLDKTAAHDGTSRSDLVEGLVLLAMDREGYLASGAQLCRPCGGEGVVFPGG